MSDEKIKGSVKWFSIRKGYGFITPSSDNAPSEEDIFFHQTSIVADGKNAFLEADYEVEFEVYKDDAGKYKCKNVTKPGGDPCEIPERKNPNPRRRGKGGKQDGEGDEEGKTEETPEGEEGKEKENKNGENKGRRGRNKGKGAAGKDKTNAEGSENGTDDKKPASGGRGRNAPRKRFDDEITPEVKAKMKEKKLDMRQTSLLLVLEKSRLKFGPEGYAALCHADGIMAEGTFKSDDEGKVTLTWKNMLKFEGGEWKTSDPIAGTSDGTLVGSFSWTDENVSGLKAIETPESLWGDDKTDPADDLQKNNFQMRKCFLAKTPANPRNTRRRPRNRNGAGRGKGGAKATEKTTENGSEENGKTEEKSTEAAAEATTEVASS
ncbi:Y-box-binding protein 2 [Seminavis robusta]|uniref:Y-box-binding protein 2 n=1 Tax=Seminavis robusta TaxID=568900 RepID=A0A9N8HS94_9STRA|nr:Y-box-binding protein 2 [Seminavis robusta]|eukprot:Sro1493_g277300.1 Y-box-binding protein 2 (378) ;mRNA; r:13249-14668